MYAIYFHGICVGFCNAERAQKLANTSMNYKVERVS